MEANHIKPFWTRIGAVFAYPAQGAALSTIILLSLARLLAYVPAIGFILNILVIMATYKFAYECLRRTAEGRMDPPEVQYGKVDDWIFWRQVGLFALVGGMLFWSAQFGAVVFWTLTALVLFSTPAMLIVLAINQSVVSAFNPIIWFAMMGRIGMPYLLLVLILVGLLVSSWTARIGLAAVLPGFIAGLLVSFVGAYFLVAMFHLLGYVVYQYHEALGFEEVFEPLTPAIDTTVQEDQVSQQAAQLAGESKFREAADLLGPHLTANGGPIPAHQQYRKYLKLVDDRENLLEHGRLFISILLNQDEHRQALSIAAECLQLDKAFELAERKQIRQLAELALQYHQPQLALRLVSGFGKRYPNSPDLPYNYLIAAKVLSEHVGEDAKARALLLQLKRKFPEHPLMPEIEQQLAMVEGLLKSQQA